MPISAQCPSCGRKMNVADKHAGKTVRCPECDNHLVVPRLKPSAETAISDAPPSAPLAAVVDDDFAPCPYCKEEIRSTAVKCKHCGERLDRQPRRKRETGFRCPKCDSASPPIVRETVTGSAWLIFVVLLCVFFPLCWLPLVLMKEPRRMCFDCRTPL